MKRWTTVGMVAAIALLAGPLGAYAGGMGIGDSVAFVCYTISGTSPGGDISLDDQFTGRDGVKIGGARLVCAPVVGTLYQNTSLPAENFKNPQPPDATADHLKCYDIRSAKDSNTVAIIELQDFFRPLAGQTVEEQLGVGVAQFLCVGATKTVVRPPAP